MIVELLFALAASIDAVTPKLPDPPAVASGRVQRIAALQTTHVARRIVDVWLPDGYPRAAPYDVVYLHDGQMLFDPADTWNHQEWRVDEVAGELIADGRVRPFIVVGIWNHGDDRVREYFPQRPFEALSPAQRKAQYALEMAPGKPLFNGAVIGDAYLKFIVFDLKPYIDRNFKVATAREHTVIMGSSLGALISLYALAEYPDVFGAAGCLSTHWPGTFKPDDNPLPAVFFDYLRQQLPVAGQHRLYFDHGTESLDKAYADLQRQVDALVVDKGYTAKDWETRVYPGAEHSEPAWAARLGVPLQFLLPPLKTPASDD